MELRGGGGRSPQLEGKAARSAAFASSIYTPPALTKKLSQAPQAPHNFLDMNIVQALKGLNFLGQCLKNMYKFLKFSTSLAAKGYIS